MLVKIFSKVIDFAAFIVIIAGTIAGWFLGSMWMYGLGIVGNIIGLVLGFLLGLVLSAVVFGSMMTLIEIHDDVEVIKKKLASTEPAKETIS